MSLVSAGDIVELLFSFHGEILVHGTGLLLLLPGHLLQSVDLLLGQVETTALVLH